MSFGGVDQRKKCGVEYIVLCLGVFEDEFGVVGDDTIWDQRLIFPLWSCGQSAAVFLPSSSFELKF